MMGPSLLIRADASLQIGAGHVMRMLALAQAWQCRGGCVHLLAAAIPDALCERLREERVVVTLLEARGEGRVAPGNIQDAEQTVALAKAIKTSWVVADGYAFDQAFQKRIRDEKFRLAMMVDSDSSEIRNSDLILNQNPHATKDSCRSLVPECVRLLGTQFALLREELVDQTESFEEEIGERGNRLLITLGGSDPQNATGQILHWLNACKEPSLKIRALVGVANPHRNALQALVEKSPHSIQLRTDVRNMRDEYSWADGIISGAGSTCWEWLYFGIPGAILVIADNQRPIYRELIDAGVAIGLGAAESVFDDAVSIQEPLERLISEMQSTRRITSSHRLVDGHGAARVAAALDNGIWIRPAEAMDRKRYFQWANDPEVRARSLCSDAIQWESHCQWFAEQMASRNAYLFVAMQDEQPIGQIRFNRTEKDAWNVAFSVDQAARGRGIGKQLVRLGTAWMVRRNLLPLVATVKEHNHASARCFRQFGWQEVPTDDEGLRQFRKLAS